MCHDIEGAVLVEPGPASSSPPPLPGPVFRCLHVKLVWSGGFHAVAGGALGRAMEPSWYLQHPVFKSPENRNMFGQCGLVIKLSRKMKPSFVAPACSCGVNTLTMPDFKLPTV